MADSIASWLIAEINGLIKVAMEGMPKAYHGAIVPGSWNPQNGTVTVRVLHTSANPNDGVSQVIDHQNVPLKTGALGHQYGPRGWELVTITPRADLNGGVAMLEHDSGTSPQAESGEQVLCHYTETGSIDAWIKLKNSTGVEIWAANKLHIYTTGGIVAIDADDATGLTQIGATGLAAEDAIATKRYVDQEIVAAFNSHEHSGVQTGSDTSGPPVEQMSFTGSATVRANQ